MLAKRQSVERQSVGTQSVGTQSVGTGNAAPALSRLYTITPDLPIDTVLPLVDRLSASVDVTIQIRCKSASDADLFRLADDAVKLTRKSGRLCIINDRLDIAQSANADGLHLGLTDMPVATARPQFDGLLGATCRNVEQARKAVADGADYLGVGPVFSSQTKPNLAEPLGVARFEEVARSVEVPVFAIGGVTPEAAIRLRAAGAYGVAVVSGIFDGGTSAVENTLVENAMRYSNILTLDTPGTGSQAL